MFTKKSLIYDKIIIKISGEVLRSNSNTNIDIVFIKNIAQEIKELVNMGVKIGLVIGGGNFYRGLSLSKIGINIINSHYIGMLSTIMNGLIFYDTLENMNVNTKLVSNIPIKNICNSYNYKDIIKFLEKRYVLIFVAGTGNPFFTTDSAACLRGLEINANIILKATKVDGIFSKDPIKYSDAIMYRHITYKDILKNKLKVMDLTAFTLAQDHHMILRIFNIKKSGVLKKIITGSQEGTLVTE
ncbi:MAG: UMP kinase [Candidatus Lightella neohaematopini]|nr:UMP kinase [Candidatus Lightella neohaematopini]